jgi:hypothetical protein
MAMKIHSGAAGMPKANVVIIPLECGRKRLLSTLEFSIGQ